MKLYYATATSSTPVHITLEEAGAAYSRVEVSWQRGLNVEELERVNPLGAAPTLIMDDGHPLTQSVAILEHIADTHPKAALLAAPGTLERARTLSWAAFCASDVLRSFTPLVQAESMVSSAAAQAELRAYALERIHPLLELLDRQLAGKTWIMGDRFTIADPYVWFVTKLAGWLEVPMDRYAFAPYFARVAARPATRRILELEDLLD
jgi:glutathione S-transferase